MKTKTMNIIGALLLILQAVLDSVNVLNFDPSFHKWLVVAITGAIIILNGIKTSFAEINSVVWVNVGLFVIFLAGGVSDFIDLFPNMAEAVKANILTTTGLVATITNIVLRNYVKIPR